MNYPQALNYILSFTDYERLVTPRGRNKFDLHLITKLLDLTGKPHLRAKTVHIAGTKGKGSTAAMLASVLRAAGFRTGLFTSPHLHSFRERITVDGALIPETELVRIVEQLQPLIEAVNQQEAPFNRAQDKLRTPPSRLSTFEIITAVAFQYFADNNVDFQVIETGLGGRLDATNVVRSLVEVLTSISLEHTDVLGETLEQIAAEKAGIVKPGTVVVTAPQQPSVMAVIEAACANQNAPLIKGGTAVVWEKESATLEGQAFTVRSSWGQLRAWIPLLGDHQLENAAAAVSALQALRKMGHAISDESIVRGLAEVRWPGRLQILGSNPWLVVDGAHNVDSARRLREALQENFRFEQLILLIGTALDKDIPGIARELAPRCCAVVATRSHHPRAADPVLVAAAFRELGIAAYLAENIAIALHKAEELATPADLICATGSLFVVAEVLDIAQKTLPAWDTRLLRVQGV